jgi:tRNA G10  N-methylase Trm11
LRKPFRLISTLKPQQFLRILVRSLLPLNHGWILDPFCGSGATVAACQAVGYSAIGVEVDTEYFSSLEENIRKLAALYPHYKEKRWKWLNPIRQPHLKIAECQQGMLL